MTNSTEYYGAQIQDVQVQISVAVLDPGNPPPKNRIYAFSQKVLSDTYTLKYTQSASIPIKSSATSAKLTYTPITLQLGRGGPSIGDPVAYVTSLYYGYDVTTGYTYDASKLNAVASITNISSSPAADLIEVTATISLLLSANIIYMEATLRE